MYRLQQVTYDSNQAVNNFNLHKDNVKQKGKYKTKIHGTY